MIVHGRFSGFGQPVNWIAADILRVQDGILVEHWDVIQDEATQAVKERSSDVRGQLSEVSEEFCSIGCPAPQVTVNWAIAECSRQDT